MTVRAADGRADSRRSRAQRVAADLEARILSERHGRGSRLGLRTELIEACEVNPSVMSEALGIAGERGLIEVRLRPNGGVFVATRRHRSVWAAPTPGARVLRSARSSCSRPVATSKTCSPRCPATGKPWDIRYMQWAAEEMRAARRSATAPVPAASGAGGWGLVDGRAQVPTGDSLADRTMLMVPKTTS